MNGILSTLTSPLSVHFAVTCATNCGEPDRWRAFLPDAKKVCLGQPDLTKEERHRVWKFERGEWMRKVSA